jgi:hypothetical protein
MERTQGRDLRSPLVAEWSLLTASKEWGARSYGYGREADKI